ncbi:MAG: hypothetical protein HQ567_07570 [Candidatus Nealsonbacteria bacterium]|nr:hypothetical protein [Candidatus Nealsonbacteria bacterium]
MQAMIDRSVVAVLLLIGGVVLFVYGTWFRNVPVAQDVIRVVEREETQTREVTLRQVLQEQLKQLRAELELSGNQWLQQEVAMVEQQLMTRPPEDLDKVAFTEDETKKVSSEETKVVTKWEREPALILELTQRGFDVLPSGGLKRKLPRDLRPNREVPSASAGICET